MPQFRRKEDVRDVMITLRATPDEAEWIDEVATKLKLRGRADLLRLALDYWQANAPEAKKLGK